MKNRLSLLHRYLRYFCRRREIFAHASHDQRADRRKHNAASVGSGIGRIARSTGAVAAAPAACVGACACAAPPTQEQPKAVDSAAFAVETNRSRRFMRHGSLTLEFRAEFYPQRDRARFWCNRVHTPLKRYGQGDSSRRKRDRHNLVHCPCGARTAASQLPTCG